MTDILAASPIPSSSPPSLARADVVVMGGGLAGLTLALQLRQRDPELDILVLERRGHPVPLAAHKVGESTVEIGAHYFSKVLGLEAHLKGEQLRKFGFRFFFSDGRRDIDRVTEIGASRYLSTPSYQIDRGLFENFLAEEAQRRGIRFVDRAVIRAVDLSEDDGAQARHHLRWSREDQVFETEARWVIDACGRAGMLKRKLGLEEDNAHPAHAVWFRIRDHIHLDAWSDDPAWRERCNPQARWMSTNHLVGAGYWVWLIPLASGSHSVGIVADPRWHPLERMNSFEAAMDWLAERQPRLFDELDGKRDKLQDFAFFKRFSYGCKQVFSARRWALTGEAGLFLDPFYSPGSDFIAISNSFITELILRDRAGQPLGAHAHLYDQVYHSFYESTMKLYLDQYGIFGDPEVLPVKVIWDYSYYWGVLAPLFFQGRIADLHSLALLRQELASCQALNAAAQDLLRDWSSRSARRNPAVMLDQAELPWFHALNRGLDDELDAEGTRVRIREAHALLGRLALEMADLAEARYPGVDTAALRAAAGSMGAIPQPADSERLLFAAL